MENTNESPRLRLRSIFAEREQRFSHVSVENEWWWSHLCQTESVRRDFTDLLCGAVPHKMDSIPAFLAAVTLQLFDQTTVIKHLVIYILFS